MRRGSGKSAAMSVRSGGGDHYLMSPGNAQMGQVVSALQQHTVL